MQAYNRGIKLIRNHIYAKIHGQKQQLERKQKMFLSNVELPLPKRLLLSWGWSTTRGSLYEQEQRAAHIAAGLSHGILG